MIRNFLRNTVCDLPFLLAADTGGASGGTPAVASVSAPPEPTGNTLEEKLGSARTIIADFFRQLSGAMSERETAQAEATRLHGQFDALTTEASTAQADVTRLTGELATVTTARDTAVADRDRANGHVTRLESLCGIKGINPNQAVGPSNNGSQPTGEELYAQWQDLKKTSPSKATAFFRKHKSELKEYADSLNSQ